MNRLLTEIDKQIEFNQGKNILLDNLDLFQFTEEIQKTISDVNKLIHLPKQFIINYIAYKSILNSLKVGGQFHYAPDLSFIEKFMDTDQFSIKKYTINELNFKTTVIKRLK